MKTTFRIPKKLNICGHIVSVEYKESIFVDGQECWGTYDSDKEIICLKKGMSEGRKKEIFLHEVIHAVIEISHATIPENSVKVLALGLLGFFNNNRINFS